MSLLHSQRLLRTSLWRFACILPTFNLSLAESAESSQSFPNTIEWYVTSIVCLVTWPLNESEAGGDLVMIETSLLLLCKSLLRHEYSIINIRKAGRFLSWQGYLQAHFHSKARHLPHNCEMVYSLHSRISLNHRLLRTLTPFLRLRKFKIFVDVRISPNLFYVKAIIDRLIV